MDISGIDCLGLDRVLRRGSGEIIFEQDDAILVRDRISGAFLLACHDAAIGLPLLDRCVDQGCDLLMVADRALGNAAFDRCGFREKPECYQVAYYGEKPACETGLTVRTADSYDLPMLIEHYQLISPEELEAIVANQNILLGYDAIR